MDTSADEHKPFQIRRSPSIGSGSSVIAPNGSRAGKRKLSATAFGSSPTMGTTSTPPPPPPAQHAGSSSDMSSERMHVDHGVGSASTSSAAAGPSSSSASEGTTHYGVSSQDGPGCQGLGLTHSHSDNGALAAAERMHRIHSHFQHNVMQQPHTHSAESVGRVYPPSLDAPGSSSNTLDATAAGSEGLASGHVHELQERRCHSLNAEREYVLSNEDRRDPRSSNACVMASLTSSQDVGGLPASSEQVPAVNSGIEEDGYYDTERHTGTAAATTQLEDERDREQACARQPLQQLEAASTSLDDALGACRDSTTSAKAMPAVADVAAVTPPKSLSPSNALPDAVGLVPNVSASAGPPSTAFFASSYFFSSSPSPGQLPSLTKGGPTPVSRLGTSSQAPSACASPSTSIARNRANLATDAARPPSRDKQHEATAREKVPDLIALPPRGWMRTSSMDTSGPAAPHQKSSVSAADIGPQNRAAGLPVTASQPCTSDVFASFRLQPVPENKRRRILPDRGLSRAESRRPSDGEGRRRSEAWLEEGPGKAHREVKLHHGLSQSSLRREMQPEAGLSGQSASKFVADPAGEVTSTTSHSSRAAGDSIAAIDGRRAALLIADRDASRFRESAAVQRSAFAASSRQQEAPPVPKLPSRPPLLSMKRSAILPDPASVSLQPKAAAAPSSRRRPSPRLRRAHSVPNLRAKATLDVSGSAHHRYIFPHHWIGYISSHGRSSKEGGQVYGGSSRGAAFRHPGKVTPSMAQFGGSSSLSRSRTIFTPSLHPPITRHTLRELDLFEILKNPQLRHDVVFDPNVQFRPNFDGERGRRKREAGERYWTAIVREIECGCTCTAFEHGELLPCTCSVQRVSNPPVTPRTDKSRLVKPSSRTALPRVANPRVPSRIPLLVQELRAICLSILPSNFPVDSSSGLAASPAIERASSPSAEASDKDSSEKDDADSKAGDTGSSSSGGAAASSSTKSTTAVSSGPSWAATHHSLIAQTLDPHLISQELQHGVLDVRALITFMGSILKLHCAPMRDEAIEKMVEVVCNDGDVGKGLRLCFEILELMKLDIANHQLRSTRPYLVDTAVEFEIRWFREQIETSKISLERTSAWFVGALARARSDLPDCSRSRLVSRAFNEGMLKLIFEPPSASQTPASPSPSPAPAPSPSSSTLNHTFSSCYPETFQFDAYRMITFHNDVADLTIVYMLLLLYRQLACSPLDGATSVPAAAATIAQRQIKAVKGEIWCLVNDANLCLSGGSSTQNGSQSGRRTPTADGKLFLGSAGGFAKLEHPRWRRAMQNVLLQVAVRAHAVQLAARGPITDPSEIKPPPPTVKTQALLNSWMDTNLCAGSPLHKLCQGRLQGAVLTMLTDKLSGMSGSTTASGTASGTGKKAGRLAGIRTSSTSAVTRKRLSDSSDTESESAGSSGDSAQKRAKTGDGTTAMSKWASPSSSKATSPPAAGDETNEITSPANWEAMLTRAGLDPFSAEIRLLCERIAKVASFHLRVFRNLYEKTEAESVKAVLESRAAAAAAAAAAADDAKRQSDASA